MLEISKTLNGDCLTIALKGWLDTSTSNNLDNEIKASVDGANELILDLKDLEYLTSAGLRVLLSTQKAMNAKKGTMKIRHVQDAVQEVFDITGFTDILNIE